MSRWLLPFAVSAAHGFVVPCTPVASPASVASRALTPHMDIDMGVVIGVGAALVGVGGGIGLIAAVEGAGKLTPHPLPRPCTCRRLLSAKPCERSIPAFVQASATMRRRTLSPV